MKTICVKLAGLAIAVAAAAVSTPGEAQYSGAPRTFLFNPALDVCIRDTSKFKKAPPYVIGFANAGLGDSWRVVGLHSLEKAAHDHADVVKKLLITDAGHDDAKQIADIQDLVSRGVDLLIVSANTSQALDPAVTQAAERGMPVVMVDRRVSSDNFVTFVTASDAMMGRMFAQWIVEKLHGKGNVDHPGRTGGIESEREPGEARHAGIRRLSRHQDPRHGVFGLEPGEGQAGDAGHDREVWAQHRCGLRAARTAGSRRDRGLPGCRLEGQRDPSDHVGRHERSDEDGA